MSDFEVHAVGVTEAYRELVDHYWENQWLIGELEEIREFAGDVTRNTPV